VQIAGSFFALSAIAFALWIAPGGRKLLAVQDFDAMMQIEGFVLAFGVFLAVGAGAAGARARERGAADPAWVLPMTVVLALGLGGSVAAIQGGPGLFLIYCLSLTLHVAHCFRLSNLELQKEVGVNMLAFFTFAGLGFLATKLPLPDFGNHYPPVFGGWSIHLKGHELLAWACAHYALLGTLQLKKDRMFAHLDDTAQRLEALEARQSDRHQTPR
jgi:hypothetical protein